MSLFSLVILVLCYSITIVMKGNKHNYSDYVLAFYYLIMEIQTALQCNANKRKRKMKMENVKFNIEQFKAVALSVQTANKVSEDASKDKGNKQNELGFYTLSALIHGNNSDLQTVLFM